ncbi:MAG: beta-ketoacyl-[acyl-carrier-protein] synthase family protein [Thermodesulfovibrionales bacterium]
MPDAKRVAVTGIGVVSSVGTGWRAYWDAIIGGRSGISPVESVDTTLHFTRNGGEVKGFSPEQFLPAEIVATSGRASLLALSAAHLSYEDAGLSETAFDRSRAATCIGATYGPIQAIERVNDELLAGRFPSRDLLAQLPPNSASALVSRHFGLLGPSLMLASACAAGNYAIGCGYDLIRAGRADIVLCGAADPFSRIAFTGFNQLSAVSPDVCRPFDLNRKGMLVAEGAAVLVLEGLSHALQRGAAVYAEIAGYGLSCDAHHMTMPSPDGIAECMRAALGSAGITADDVDYVCAHGTGTAANDRNECAAIRSVFGERASRIPVSSVKSMLGHAMGAASALEAAACVLAARYDIVPPTMNFETRDPDCGIDCVPNTARRTPVRFALNNSYAFGGNNASVVIAKYQEREGC